MPIRAADIVGPPPALGGGTSVTAAGRFMSSFGKLRGSCPNRGSATSMLRAEIRIPTASLSRCLAAKGVNSAPREVVMIQPRTACWHLVALTALTGCGSRDDALSALYGPDVSGVQ